MLPEDLLGHQVVVEAYTGTTGNGVKQYALPETVACLVEPKRRLVRDERGDQIVSETTVYANPPLIAPPQSRVTLPSGHGTTVIVYADHDGGGLPTPDHVELNLA